MSSPANPPTDPLPWDELPSADPAPEPATPAPPPTPATRSGRGRPSRTRLFTVVRGSGLAFVFAVLALGAAGLTAQLQHPPGTPARAELTFAGDMALTSRLDAAARSLNDISDQVDRLAGEAKTALAETTSVDPARLRAALQRGGQVAAAIDVQSSQLRDELADLPGGGADAALQYRQFVLVRRAALTGALDATSTLASEWSRVTAHAGDAAKLTGLIAQHDATVVDAAAQGRDSQFNQAITTLATAQGILDSVAVLRAQLVTGSDVNVLDEWVNRNRDYDRALSALYAALQKSGGKSTIDVQAAYRDERGAFNLLPADRRAIIVIVAEVAQNGLNQAVLAIEEASARIEQALATSESEPESPAP